MLFKPEIVKKYSQIQLVSFRFQASSRLKTSIKGQAPTQIFTSVKGVTSKILLTNEHLLQLLMPTMTADMNNWSPETCWYARTSAGAFGDLQFV